MIYLDRHVVLWLYSGDVQLLSQPAQDAIEESELLISPVVLLELEMLREIKRISVGPQKIRSHLEDQIGLRLCELPFASVVSHSLKVDWTRDSLDRLIIGQCIVRGEAALVTKDRRIRANYKQALW